MNHTIALVVGTRPNFVKAAPVLRALQEHDNLQPLLIHSGQHSDNELFEHMFRDLSLPKPDMTIDARVGEEWDASLCAQKLHQFFLKEQPSLVVIFGDVNTAAVAAQTADACHIPIAHVEAGLRNLDIHMTEEHNRATVDQLSSLLFASEPSAVEHLRSESIEESVHLVGNTMIDSLVHMKDTIEMRRAELSIDQPCITVTLHRRELIHDEDMLQCALEQLQDCAKDYALYWPMHPHTRKMIEEFGLSSLLQGITILPPQGYIDFLALVMASEAIITDSGGIQEETTYLNIPCFTVREATERPVTVESGSNTLIPLSSLKHKPLSAYIQSIPHHSACPIPLWDGKASVRIANCIAEYCTELTLQPSV